MLAREAGACHSCGHLGAARKQDLPDLLLGGNLERGAPIQVLQGAHSQQQFELPGANKVGGCRPCWTAKGWDLEPGAWSLP